MKRTARTWTLEEKEIVKELLAEQRLYREISVELENRGFGDRSAESVRKMLQRERVGTSTNPRTEPAEFWDLVVSKIEDANQDAWKLNQEMETNFHKALDGLDQLRESLTEIKYTEYGTFGRPENPDLKILTISDLHIPMHNTDVIADALINHADADILVINGDYLDVYTPSKWPKEKEICLKHEYKIGLELLNMLANIFPKVILVSGNHEKRLESYFKDQINPTVRFLIEDDILDYLAKGMDIEQDEDGFDKLYKKYDFDNVYYDGGQLNWYCKVGQCVFVHPSYFSSIPMRTALNAATTLGQKEDFQCLIMSHTHKLGKIIKNDVCVIEQGCCCVPLDYEANSRMGYAPQSFGYAVVYMDKDGNVDFNKSNPVYYGTECKRKHGKNHLNEE